MNKHIIVTFVAAAVLSACGGGGGGDETAAMPGPLEQVPADASASATGLAGYIGSLQAAGPAADNAEPLDLTQFNPPQPEDAEPEPVS